MKEERLFSWTKVLKILLLAGLVYTLTGGEELSLWSRDLSSPRARFLFTRLLTPGRILSTAVTGGETAGRLKQNFHILKDRSFKDYFSLGFSLPAPLIPENRNRTAAAVSQVKAPAAPAAGAVSNQPSGEIAMVHSGPPVPPAPAAAPEKIIPPPRPPGPPSGSLLLVGDSLALSCGTAFIPLAGTFPELTLEKYSRVSANLANPVFDNWFFELDRFLMDKKFDNIVIILGANAAQDIVEDGERHGYNSPQWREIYKKRAGVFISMLKNGKNRIYWVGIPPMYTKPYRENMVIQNEIIKEVCRENSINFLPIQYILGNDQGLYADYKMIRDRQVRIRSADRIHYTMAGGDLLSRYILEELFPGNSFYQD